MSSADYELLPLNTGQREPPRTISGCGAHQSESYGSVTQDVKLCAAMCGATSAATSCHHGERLWPNRAALITISPHSLVLLAPSVSRRRRACQQGRRASQALLMPRRSCSGVWRSRSAGSKGDGTTRERSARTSSLVVTPGANAAPLIAAAGALPPSLRRPDGIPSSETTHRLTGFQGPRERHRRALNGPPSRSNRLFREIPTGQKPPIAGGDLGSNLLP